MLAATGVLDRPEGPVRLEDVSARRAGQRMAFVMDTGMCDAAVELAALVSACMPLSSATMTMCSDPKSVVFGIATVSDRL